MNRFFQIAAAAALVAFAGASAHAATSGAVKLSGKVDAVCQVAVTDHSAALDLVKGETNAKVATIVEDCNDPQGFKISFASQNGGDLKSDAGHTADYTVNYDSTQNRDLNGGMQLNRQEAQFSESHELTVNIPSSDTRTAGTYTDTITVTIAAN